MPDPDTEPQDGARPRFRAVLFDAGNTLIYMPYTAEDILRELCRHLGISIDWDQAHAAYKASERYYVENYLGYRGDQGEFWHRYHGEALRALGVDDPDQKKAAFLSHGFGHAGVWQPYPEAAAVCRQLQDMGLRLGVVSNGSITVRDLLEQSGLLPFFDTVVSSQEVGIAKPDPRIFNVALDRMSVAPEDALFVGDLYDADVLGSESAGLTGVLIDRDSTPDVERDCPVIRSLEGLIPLVTQR